MKQTILFLVTLLTLPLHASNWIVEAEGNGSVTWSKDSIADIHAPGGLTLWNRSLLTGNVTIEYEARIVSDGRISDLNCFWMASDPSAKDVFVNMKKRGGKFVNSYTMQLYYVGYGGNHNSTTRFRRYDGDTRAVTNAKLRPAILREYLDKDHMISADHWYKIRLETKDGHVRYSIDGECLVDFVDPQPLTQGYFGFRTTLSHAQFRNYKTTCHNPDNAPIPLHNVGDGNRLQPTTFGIPFDKGELKATDKLSIITSSGSIVSADQWTLASWPDGSVKWKAMAAVVPANSSTLSVAKNIKTKDTKKGKSADPEGQLTLFPSRINGTTSKQTNTLLDSICISGRKVCGALWIEQNGNSIPVNSITHEQSGTIRDTWRFEGDQFMMRLYTYRGSNEIKAVLTTFIDSLTNANGLQSLSVRTEVPLHDALHMRKVHFLTKDSGKPFTMDVKPVVARRPVRLNNDGTPIDSQSKNILHQLAAWDGFRLSQLSPNAFSIRKRATETSPWIGTIEGLQSPGVVAVGDTKSSVAFHLTDFWQSYPSTLQVDEARSDNAIVSLYLWSKEAEAMNFAHYDTIPHGLDAAYEDVQEGMSTAYGTAHTTTFYIYPTLSATDSIKEQLTQLAQHAQYLPTPEYLHRKRAFGYWSLDKGTALDSLLRHINNFYAEQQKKHGWYGYFNYGDVMHSYDASRDEWRYDVGGFAWDNTELGTPAMLWYQFLRTADKDAWRMAVAMTRHCSEVDCYHRGPHAGLGTRHNVLHWGCGAKEARISEAFWNRFLYYLTADERMGDLMHEVVDADQLLYKLDPMRLAQPRSDRYPCTAPARLRIGPDWLAYAGNWFTEWERTGNNTYRDKILAGMKSIAALPNGIFSGPKALGYDPATGIITWEGDTAVQNTNHLLTIMGGFEMMNEMMLSLNTPEWEKTWLTHAKDYKEKALTISRNNFRIPRLQGYGYWFTGKETYLINAFSDLSRSNPIYNTNSAATFTLDAIFLQEVCNDRKTE